MTTRNPEFDRQLVAYLPTLRRIAFRIAKHTEAAEELLSQATIEMLKRHATCRMETFKTWAQLMVRSTAKTYARDSRRLKRSAPVVPIDDVFGLATEPNQQHAAELSEAVRRVSSGRDGDIIIRRAMGETMEEIGLDYGIGKERVRQLEQRERDRLVAMAGVAHA